MRLILLTLLCVGCADPKATLARDRFECRSTWEQPMTPINADEGGPFGYCDGACTVPPQMPSNQPGPDCETNISKPDGTPLSCSRSFEYDGILGCCFDADKATTIEELGSGASEPSRDRRVFFLTCK